jgi:hypothetical protein
VSDVAARIGPAIQEGLARAVEEYGPALDRLREIAVEIGETYE